MLRPRQFDISHIFLFQIGEQIIFLATKFVLVHFIAVLVTTSQDSEQLCYQLLVQPFIGGFSIQSSVRSEEVIKGLPVG